MAETTSTKEKEPTTRQSAAKPDPETDAPPVPEASPALGSVNAAYYDPPGNWSDPPELAEQESEYEGSRAKKPEDEAKEDREKIRDEERKRVREAIEQNAKTAEKRAEWDARQAKKREGRG